MSLSIGPEITVGALLSTFPALEGVLVDMAPAFAKLRNPVVRRTVAKIATLEQVAAIGGVNLQAMILKLRAAAGVDAPDEPVLAPVPGAGADASYLMAGLVVEEIDADAMLERGVHPIGKIREAVSALKTGESVLLRSSFVPQPLIETLRRAGAAVHSSTLAGKHLTWFGKTEPRSHR